MIQTTTMPKSIIGALVSSLLLFAAAVTLTAQSTGTVMPSPVFVGFDASGNPVSNGKLCTQVAGTSTNATTYSDVGLTTQNSNPVVLNSAGRATVYLVPGQSYKFILRTAGTSSTECTTGTIQWTADNIAAVPSSSNNLDVLGTAGEALTAGQAVYLSDGSGGKTAGQWFKADSSNTYSSLTPLVGMAPSSISSATAGSIRLTGQMTGLSSLVVGTTYYLSTAGALTSTAPTFRRAVGVADTTSTLDLVPWPTRTAPAPNGVPQGRLTLTSGTAVTTADVTGSTNVYYTPYTGNRISLYDGTDTWTTRTFSEITLALGTLVNAQAYDVFAYDNAGAVALETAEWANATNTMTIAAPGVVTWTSHGMSTGQSITFTTTGALPTGVTANTQYWITTVDANTFKLSTTLANVAAGTFITTTGSQSGTHTGHQPQARQTALTTQEGVLVKTGATTRRYLGSFLTTATTTTDDSFAKRDLWNYYNRVKRELRNVAETTNNWNYTIDTFQQANASTANQFEVLVGVAEVELAAEVIVFASNPNAGGPVTVTVGIGEDATTTTPSGELIVPVSSVFFTSSGFVQPRASLKKYPTVGRHAYLWLERSVATSTTTWYGDNGTTYMQSGILGTIEG